MPRDRSIRSVLIIGSGPIIIGQACEFDYAGSQAARSLREEGIEVILINSNPATIRTDKMTDDYVYLKPLEKKYIREILEKHHIDAVLPTMGGQTALNLCIDCDKAGIWEHYGVKIIGVDILAIETTEDREKFRLKMHELGVGVCNGATAMTLPDTVYQNMRDLAIRMMNGIGKFAGGCNVQFAVNPETDDIVGIEINPHVSRSSALASKATGYPIAKIAAKLAIGYNLDELQNQITKSTSAYFEPTLDYVVVKIPRWNFDKFPGGDRQLGLQMKSVGEVMAIGRSFIEALQKACQSLEINRHGLGADGSHWTKVEEIVKSLEHPSWDRVFHIKDAFKLGVPVQSVYNLTKIDKWFLVEIQNLVFLEEKLRKFSLANSSPGGHSLDNVPKDFFLELKQKGYSDAQIAFVLGNVTEEEVCEQREKLDIRRVYKMVDTCAAEFPAGTPYYYSTFENEFQVEGQRNRAAENESIVSNKKKVIVLGSGPNRIGQGIEFDYSCVHGVLAARESGYEAIMINCNPETVSTDFDIADKLYFEPVNWEHIYEIIEYEKPEGVIVQLRGQTALKLAKRLTEKG